MIPHLRKLVPNKPCFVGAATEEAIRFYKVKGPFKLRGLSRSDWGIV